MSSKTADLLASYDECHALHVALVKHIEDFLGQLCAEKNIKIHAITGRVKEKSSFSAKIERLDKSYQKLSDVYDVSGVRVITYLKNDVDLIARMIEAEFSVDSERSSTKGSALDPDRFGYSSVHYVVSLQPRRLRLSEFKRFKDCVAEIQVRSIIQHSWAEIEHDLGYKSKVAVPNDIKRRFSRLAALLELADEEFSGVTSEIARYEKQLTKRIKEQKSDIPVDGSSITVFIKNNALVAELDTEIATRSSVTLETPFEPESHAARLRDLGVNTLAEVEALLKRHKKLIVAWASDWLGQRKEKLPSGISIFYLIYLLLASTRSSAEIKTHLATVGGFQNHPQLEDLVKRIVDTYSRLK